MKDKIQHYLKQLEEEKNITILLACETGSRAWGFPSPDSDYDIRIIYKHNIDWYLSLQEQKDSIDVMYDNNDIDITGWDIRKSLRLLTKSNAPLLERIQSPIIYKADDSFLAGINELAKDSYSKIATMYHYLNMAKKCFGELDTGGEYKLKKFFYALRTSVTCLWIIEKNEIPPIEFPKMLEGLNLSTSITNRIKELIVLKATINEGYLHKGEEELLAFITACIEKADLEANKLSPAKSNAVALNEFFRKTIRQ